MLRYGLAVVTFFLFGCSVPHDAHLKTYSPHTDLSTLNNFGAGVVRLNLVRDYAPGVRATYLSDARANETTPGVDVLALAKYCETFLKAPVLPAFSTLLNTFGNPLPCVEQKIIKGGIKKVQIDLRDATCFRNNVCPPGTPPLTDWSVLLRRSRAVNILAVRYPEISWWISPWLEHDIKSDATVRKACAVVMDGCPTCRCINSPFTGAKPPEIPLEVHGTTVTAFSVSADGQSSFDGDNIKNDGNTFQHRLAGKNQTYAWWNELNLRCTGEEDFTPPLERTERPKLWQFRMAHKIMTSIEDPTPPVPSRCRSLVKITKPEINKPLAESYCNGQQTDMRGNKPLLILRKSGSVGQRMNVLSPNGTSVGCFRYYGPFTQPGLHRWYMGDCSGENAWELYEKLGQEWGFAEMGAGRCVIFNSIRRQGVYR